MDKLIKKIGLKPLNYAQNKIIEDCYIGDILSFAMANLKQNNLWITSQININVIALAVMKNVSAVILPNNLKMDDDVIKMANKENVNVFSSCLSTYELTKKISEIID